MLKYFLLTFLFFTSAYGGKLHGLKTDERIVGGQDADIKEAPYQAAILYGVSIYTPVFSGVILSETTVMTIAYAVYDTSVYYFRIRVGSTYSTKGGQYFAPTRYIVHPDYDSYTTEYDVGLFVLPTKIIFDGITMKPVALPTQDAFIPDYSFGMLTGWGYIGFDQGEVYTETLQKTILPVINQQVCDDAFTHYPVLPGMICAGNMQTGGEGACLRDRGSPFVINGTVIGIYSWSIGCGQPGVPNVFVRIPAIRNWLDKQLELLE